MDRKEKIISVRLLSHLKILIRKPLCLLAEEASGEECLGCSHHTSALCVDRHTTCPESGSRLSRFRQNVCSREQEICWELTSTGSSFKAENPSAEICTQGVYGRVL